jgi:hypothetical protein
MTPGGPGRPLPRLSGTVQPCDGHERRKEAGMDIAVVFESMYGATHDIADAITDGIRDADPQAVVTCLRVGDADTARVAAVDLLVVGGPTHMRGMTSGMSRKFAAQAEEKRESEGQTIGHGLEPGAEGPGLRDWFHQLPKKGKGRHAAAFDTRIEGRMAGAAAKGIAHRLEEHGYGLVARPEGFLVEGEEQLLRAGERERARAWGAGLVRSMTVSRAPF